MLRKNLTGEVLEMSHRFRAHTLSTRSPPWDGRNPSKIHAYGSLIESYGHVIIRTEMRKKSLIF